MSKAPLLLLSLAASGASAAIDYAGRKRVEKDQRRANEDWMSFQRRKAAEYDEMERAERDRARGELDTVLEDVTQEAQTGVIEDETARLTDKYITAAGLDTDFTKTDARGDPAGAQRSGVFEEDLAAELANTSADAKKRIAALAKASAYGGGTQHGRGQTLADLFGDATTNMAFINDGRRGDTRMLQRYQSRTPEIFEYKQSPLVPILSALGTVTGAAAGAGGFGNLFGGAGGGAGPALNAAKGIGGGPGMTFGTGLSKAVLPAGPGLKGPGLSFLNVPWNNNVIQY